MRLISCAREGEVRELLRLGCSPQAYPSDLSAHVDQCRACRDLILVTRTLRTARDQAAQAANLNAPGLLWWRAQLRRRNEGVERIGRPILGAQIFALVVNLLMIAAVIASQAKHGLRWTTIEWLQGLAKMEHLSQSRVLNFESFWSIAALRPDWGLMTLIPGLAILALLSGVVLYLASDRQ